MKESDLEPRILHHIGHADHAAALLEDDSLVAWLTHTGAEVGRGHRATRSTDKTGDSSAAPANNGSPLVSEFVRSFMTYRIKEESRTTAISHESTSKHKVKRNKCASWFARIVPLELVDSHASPEGQ
jgi:hypothetical protein